MRFSLIFYRSTCYRSHRLQYKIVPVMHTLDKKSRLYSNFIRLSNVPNLYISWRVSTAHQKCTAISQQLRRRPREQQLLSRCPSWPNSCRVHLHNSTLQKRLQDALVPQANDLLERLEQPQPSQRKDSSEYSDFCPRTATLNASISQPH